MLSKEQLKDVKEFGIDVDNLTHSESIDELIKRAHLLSLSAEFTDKEFLRREIVRALKPSN